MLRANKRLVLAALVAAFAASGVHAEKKTVCTITINSPDEKEVFRRNLPAGDFDFVELVEHGNPDWFASACKKRVQCDVLMISGHFDGGTDFYSDRRGVRESLPVADMEAAACSDSCPGVFAHLKEVYLFGCNTLNPEPLHGLSPDIVRSLVRAGHSPADVDRIARTLAEQHGDSNRDRMRRIFADVPTIYGFSAKAPLGSAAGPVLERYFNAGTRGEVGSGHPSAKLLSLFAPASMTVTTGVAPADPLAGYRAEMCRFADGRLSTAQKLAFVHELLQREPAEVRLFLDALEQYTASLPPEVRSEPAVANALADIAHDAPARTRYLEFVRDADESSVRVRMIEVAQRLGWLNGEERRAELMRVVGDRLAAKSVTAADVDLVCTLNRDGALGAEARRLGLHAPAQTDAAHAAVLACLDDPEAHARVVGMLTGGDAEATQMAQVYFRHHPLSDVAELRSVALRIGAMSDAAGQVRALETLAPLKVSDHESLDALTRLFPVAKSVGVQRAIASVLIRAEDFGVSKPELARVLREHRLKSPDGEDVIDVLIRRYLKS